jgi:hypothetical protein
VRFFGACRCQEPPEERELQPPPTAVPNANSMTPIAMRIAEDFSA